MSIAQAGWVDGAEMLQHRGSDAAVNLDLLGLEVSKQGRRSYLGIQVPIHFDAEVGSHSTFKEEGRSR